MKEFEKLNSKIDNVENRFNQHFNRKQKFIQNGLELYLEENLEKLILT